MLYSELFKIVENLNSIGYFVDQSTGNSGHEIKISDLRTKIENLKKLIENNKNKIEIIDDLLSTKETCDTKYLAGSKISAVNKGREVINQLLDIDLTDYGFISLGGGDGTELFTEIENSVSNYGLLLEYDYDCVNRYTQNIIPFKLKHFKRWKDLQFDVIECDIFDKQKLTTAKRLIQSKNLNGIIVSIHAVLHELSTRSQLKDNFSNENGELVLEDFFREIYEWHDNIIIIIREPGIPENWPQKNIYLTIAEEYLSEFLKILEDIDNIHFEGTKKPNFNYLEKQKQIRCIPILAMEALTKLFYIEDYSYEKREKITSVSREKITKALQAGEKLYDIIKTETFFTTSIQLNMNKFGVKVIGEESLPLSNPQCFTYTIASKGNHMKNSQKDTNL
jgi:hypothetical protein